MKINWNSAQQMISTQKNVCYDYLMQKYKREKKYNKETLTNH